MKHYEQEILYTCTQQKSCHKTYTMAIASDFTFATQLGFAKGYHKLTHRGNVGMILGYELPKIVGLPLNIFATVEASDFKCCKPQGFARPIIKLYVEETVGIVLD